MLRIEKKDWKDICACEYIGVELNSKRPLEGWEDENKRAVVMRLSNTMYCFYDPLEPKGFHTHIEEKVISKSIVEALESLAKRIPIKVYQFKDPESLNDFAMNDLN